MVPVTISPPAGAFIDRTGQRGEFEAMIEQARHVVPAFRSIEVVLDEAADDIPPGIILWMHRADIGKETDATQRHWIDWMAATLAPEVCQNLVLLPVYCDDER
jgi:hypothetical protein